ncbi:MAG TPA: M23 family metallopeptidase, partial [Candidatus Atribacteria bacterium]|nr:M23 family metallopeptidase [Candidatus Atribacteria bacterium]
AGKTKDFMVSKASALAQAPLHKKRRVVAIAVVSVFVFTGAIVGVKAVTSPVDQAAELVDAFKVSLRDKHIGYVEDVDTVAAIISQVRQEAMEVYAMEVELDTAFNYEKVAISPELLTQTSEIARAVRSGIDVKVNACALLVNGEQIGILRSDEEVGRLLDLVKQPFLTEGSSVESVEIVEEVETVPVCVDYGEVLDAESLAEEIARGRETVEEYTVVSGDTLWSISKKYDMTIDELAAMNPEIQDLNRLRLGQKLKLSYPKSVISVATVELVEYEVAIPYKTEYTKDKSMYTNQSKTVRSGKNGAKLVQARVSKVNGVEESREIISEKVIKEPVTMIIAQGTKAIPLVSRGSGALLWPTKGNITSGFGYRYIFGKRDFHHGIDIANSVGTPIYAAEAGTVTFTGRDGSYGNLIKIDHGENVETRYAHLSQILVSKGQQVKRGQLIAYMGNTGRTTGPHLHFEVRLNGTALNPRKYLD